MDAHVVKSKQEKRITILSYLYHSPKHALTPRTPHINELLTRSSRRASPFPTETNCDSRHHLPEAQTLTTHTHTHTRKEELHPARVEKKRKWRTGSQSPSAGEEEVE